MKRMKKIIIVFLTLPIVIFIGGITKYNLQLSTYFSQDTKTYKNKSLKQEVNKTKVHIVGTIHFETDDLKRQHFYNYIDSISPSIILYEGDSSTVKRIVKKTDYLARFMDAFKSEKRIEKPIVLKYLNNNPNCKLLPYEWELRNKYHRKHRLRKNSKKLINAVINLYFNNLLTKNDSITIDRFLEINRTLTEVDKTPKISNINSLLTDSILKIRQHYIYKEIPEIAMKRKELAEYSDFIPIHMNY